MTWADEVAGGAGNHYPRVVESAHEARILSMVRQASGVSRATLAARLGMSRSTLEARLARLMQLGLIREAGAGPSSGGRRARLLVYSKEAGYIIAVDLGATSVDVAITNLNAEVLLHRTEAADVRQGPEPVLGQVARLIDQVFAETGIGREQICGVGMGVPGPVEFRTGQPVSPPIMPGWHRFDVRAYLEERHRCPVFVDNDVNIMALGERWAGIGRQFDNFVFVKIGSGIGCGIICRGQIYRGVDGSAGDIGHLEATSEPVVCRCGNLGCLEAVAGGIALGRQAEEAARSGASPYLAQLIAAKGTLSAEDLSLAVQQGDPEAMRIVRAASSLVGGALARLVNFYNPGLIILGGGVTNLGNTFLASIREAIYQRSLPLATSHLVIQRSGLADSAGVVGAAALVLGELYNIIPITEELRFVS